MKNFIQLIICIMIASLGVSAQTFEIRGKVHTINPNEPIPFATLSVYLNSTMINGTTSDLDGNFVLHVKQEGKYHLKSTCVGFQPNEIKDIIVLPNKVTFVDVILNKGAELKEMVVTEYKVPIIERENIQQAPTRDVNSIASSPAGVFQKSEGNALNIRGSRSDATAYYVDGIKIRDGVVPNTDNSNEEYARIAENQFYNTKRRPLSTFSIDVDGASYSNIRRYINQGSLPPKDAVRIEEMINYFSYQYSSPETQDPFGISTEIGSCAWNPQHKIVKVGLSGKEIATENLPPSNLVFLIDVSGSMQSPDKLPLLKSSFYLLVQQLRPVDIVSIVVYAGSSGLVLPPTSGIEKEKILASIEALQAGGSTAGGEGIKLAYNVAKQNFNQEGNNRVILATDGDFNVGVSSDAELVSLIEKQRETGIFLTVLGFGTGNYKDSKMEGLADKGNGNFSYVDNILEAQKVFVKEMGATLNTIAKDVKLQIEFNPAYVKAYRLIGYENRVLEDRDFNDDKKDAGELGSGRKVTALYEIIPSDSKDDIDEIDSLKYQKTIPQTNSSSGEMMTIKFRYKDPQGGKSKLIVHPLLAGTTVTTNSDDFRFASAVAEFGMILRDSQFKGTSDYKQILALARGSKGTDAEGYRAEFIRLVETAEILAVAENRTSVK